MIGPAPEGQLHLMSFNIRCDRTDTVPGDADYWPDRAPLVERLLRLEQPTILGVQEAQFHQLPAIEAGLPASYATVGFGRDGGSSGEHCSLFFDTDRLAVLEWDQFWLSDTPLSIGSQTWGNNVTRIVTWARFLDALTGGQFIAVNTHFDHQSENARVNSALLLVELADLFGNLPMVVTGDFNCTAGDSWAYTLLVESGRFADTWDAATHRLTAPWGTFPNYGPPVAGDPRIDWILVTPESVVVRSAAVNSWHDGGCWPSDHAPVQALVSIGA